jgi:methyl coenzyme M reductase subunit D
VITIRISNGQTATGQTVEDACRELVDARLLPVAVKVDRGKFIPASDATVADVLKYRALWYKKAGSWHVAALVDEVTESATA